MFAINETVAFDLSDFFYLSLLAASLTSFYTALLYWWLLFTYGLCAAHLELAQRPSQPP